MLALVAAVLLSQAPPVCDDGGVDCSPGGFMSRAGLNYGSGTPDFTCGSIDNLPDGGWGPQSKYCLIRTNHSEYYDGYHGDLTIAGTAPRRAGWLFHLNNGAFGGPVFTIDWRGNVWSYASFFVTGNGAGLENTWSYLRVAGRSTTPGTIPDVIAVASGHADGGYQFGVSGAGAWNFRVRDDGVIALRDVALTVAADGDALRLTQHLPDGGTRTASLAWSDP